MSPSEMKQGIIDMAFVIESEMFNLNNLKRKGLLNTGDAEGSQNAETSRKILGKSISFINSMFKAVSSTGQRRALEKLSKSHINQNRREMVKMLVTIQKGVQLTSLANQPAVEYKGDQMEIKIQKQTAKLAD